MSPIRPAPLFALVLVLLLPLPAGATGEPCPEVVPLVAGIDDGFAGGLEEPEPSPTLLSYAEKSWPQRSDRQFDENRHDTALLHTFRGWEGPVCGATLTLRVRATTNSLSVNDSFRLGLIGGEDPQAAFRYWVTFRFALGDWGPEAEGLVRVDLADLPAYGGFDTDILDELDDGELEFLVEDDTDIDFARLDVCPCSGGETVPFEAVTWGALKSRYADLD